MEVENSDMIICCGEALIDMVRARVPGSGEGFLPLPGGSPYNTAADLSYIYPGTDTGKAIERILTIGPRLVIATLGPDGVLALLRRDDGSVIRVSAPAVDVPIADTIGAGV